MVSSKNQPVLYEFERRRLVAELRPMGENDVSLKQGSSSLEKQEISKTNLMQNLPACNSSHCTFPDVLELSERENLSQCVIKEVTPISPLGGKMVKFRCKDDYAELLQRIQELGEEISSLQENISTLEERVEILERKTEETKPRLIERQVMSLTIAAMDSFFWANFSEEDKRALRGHGISTYAQLYHAVKDYLDETDKRTVARGVFNTIDEDLTDIAWAFLEWKRELGLASTRTSLAPYSVKKKVLLSYLTPFFPVETRIKPVQKTLFEHLKKTANSTENIRRALAAQRLLSAVVNGNART